MYLKKALRGTVFVFIFTVIAVLLGYIFRIVLAKNLTIAQYGLFYAMFSFFSFLIIFIDLGLGQAVSKYIVDYNVDNKKEKIKSLLVSVFVFQIAVGIVLFLLFLLFVKPLSENFFKTQNVLLFIFMGVWFFTSPIPSFYGSLFQGYQRPGLNASVDAVRQFLMVILTILFLTLNFGLTSPFIAFLLLHIILLLIYFPFIKNVFPEFFNIKTHFDRKLLYEILKYGIYIAFSGVILLILTQTDTLLITYFLGVESAGLYQVAIPLANLVTFVVGVVLVVAFPMIAELYKTHKFELLSEGMQLLYKYLIVVILPVAIVLFTFPETIISVFFDPKYVSAAGALRLLALTGILSSITTLNNMALSGIGFPKEIAKTMVYVALLNIVLNIFLIQSWGIQGAALSTTISFFVGFILSYLKLRKKIKITLPGSAWIKTLIAGVLTTLLIFFLKKILTVPLILELSIIALGACIVYTGLLFVLRVIDYTEIKKFIKIVKP